MAWVSPATNTSASETEYDVDTANSSSEAGRRPCPMPESVPRKRAAIGVAKCSLDSSHNAFGRRRMSFGNRTVIVTGAAGNLGAAVARAFADLGGNLVLVDLKRERLE